MKRKLLILNLIYSSEADFTAAMTSCSFQYRMIFYFQKSF